MLGVPGRAPPILAQTRRRARPMVALARQPGPNRPSPELMSSAARAGPLTMKRGATASVVPETPRGANASSHMASTPARTAGRYSGRQPAITAFTAIRSTVARPAAATARATRSRVGGTTGSPSVTPRAKRSSTGSASISRPPGSYVNSGSDRSAPVLASQVRPDMFEIALVLIAVVAAGLIGFVATIVTPSLVTAIGLATLVLGLVLGVPTGFWYHVILYRSLSARSRVPAKWWLVPSALHPQLTDAERRRIRPWYRLGGVGFVLSVVGGLAAIGGVLLAR